MNIRKYRWSKHYESAEEELLSMFQTKHIDAAPWTAEPMESFEPTVQQHDTHLWCAEGSIIFTVDNQRFSLQPGDALDIPANVFYEAVAGISGCVCYQNPPRA